MDVEELSSDEEKENNIEEPSVDPHQKMSLLQESLRNAMMAQRTQLSQVVAEAIRLIIFTQRIKTLYEEGYHELITVGISTTAQRVWLKFFCVEYESIKAHYRIRLSESLFNKLNPQLSETWEKLSSQIKISTGG